MVKICRQCGEPFVPYRSNQFLCSSDECRKRHHAEWDHAHYLKEKAARPATVRRCIVCGKEFTPPAHHRKERICSAECRRQRYKESDAKYAANIKVKRTPADYLAYLEETYGRLSGGTLRQMVDDWSKKHEQR